MENPNTVSGLIRKRDELHKLRKALEAEIHKLTCDIDHLDAAISLFDASQTPRAIQRYVTKHRAKKGHMLRFVLNCFRGATGPLTSKQITEMWTADRGLKTDEATYVILRKRVGAVLVKLKNDGTIRALESSGDYKLWVLSH